MRRPLGRAVPSLVWLSVSMATSTQHAPLQRPRQRACPPKQNAGAACPDRVSLILASASLDRAPAQHAPLDNPPPQVAGLVAGGLCLVMLQSPMVCGRSCSSRNSVGLSCSVARAALSLLPISTERRLVMLRWQVHCSRSCSPRSGAVADCLNRLPRAVLFPPLRPNRCV